jgi:PAS domain S-box-containing protein
MGMPASVSIVMLGVSVALIAARSAIGGWVSYLAAIALAISSLSLIGYVYGADQLYSIPKYTGIAFQTATMIAAIALGVSFALPRHGVVAALFREDAGGLVFRRLVLPAILIVRTLAEIFLLLGLLWITSNSISRLDAETRSVSLLPAENPNPVMRMSAEGKIIYTNPAAKELVTQWQERVANDLRQAVAEAFETQEKREIQLQVGERAYAAVIAPLYHGGYINVYCTEITERLRSERMLERKANEISVLYQLSDRMTRAADLDEIYEASLDAITDGLECDRASILLFDEDKVMSFVAWRGLSEGYRAAVNGHSPWKYGETNCRAFGISDIRSSDQPDELKNVITGEGIIALAFVPLVSNGTLHGKFMVYYDQPHEFIETELEFATTIGNQVAFGVEKRRAEQRRREVESALVENDARFRLATRTGKVGLWDWDILTDRVTWSDSLYVMHGIDESGFDGTVRGFRALIHPDDRERVHAAIDRALAEKEPYELEMRAVRPEGRVVWLYTNASVLRDGDTPIRMIGATVDITERKLAENERSKLAAIVESSNDAIISKDLNSIIMSWNRAAESVFGYTADEVIGKPITILFPEDRLIEEEHILTRIRRGENVDHYETVRKRKDGSLVEISLSISPIRDEAGKIIGASKIARNITEKKAAAVALRESEIMHRLVEAQEAERRRIARDLHDHLGQQLTALRLKLESLRTMVAHEASLLTIVDETRQQAERIDMDVNFLSWELRPTELENLGLADALSSFIREWSINYGIAAEFHVGTVARGRLAPELETNLYRIVQEGLNNILKHAGAKEVNVLLEHRDGHAVLIIEDDGIGFDPDTYSSNGTNSGSGGLGLIGMRERAALLGGTLEIETRRGEGTAVFARIPIPSNGIAPAN